MFLDNEQTAQYHFKGEVITLCFFLKVHYPHVGHESHPQHGEPFRERKETRLPGRGEGGHGSHGPQLNYRNSTVPLHQNQTFQHNPNIPISHSDIISPNISNQFNNNNINILSLKPPTQQI